MLVFPKGERVELVFGGGGWVTAGHVFTALGLLLFAVAALPPGRRALAALGRAGRGLVPAPVTRLVAATGRWSVSTRRRVVAGGVAVAAIAFACVAVATHAPDADGVYRHAQRLYDAGHLDESLPLFREARRLAPMSSTAFHSTFFAGLVDFRQERWAKAEATFRDLLATFPEAPNAPEALYHVAVCRLRQGDAKSARRLWEEVRTRFPTVPWAGYAADRLRELDASPGG